jgi:hypothetical protein
MDLSQPEVQAHCNPRSCGCKELSRQRTDGGKQSTKAQQCIYKIGEAVVNSTVVARFNFISV